MKIYDVSMKEEEEKHDNSPTVVFVNFNRALNKPLEKLSVPKLREARTINDISWALMNGRSYYILGVASDAFIKVFELGIRESQKELPVIDVLK